METLTPEIQRRLTALDVELVEAKDELELRAGAIAERWPLIEPHLEQGGPLQLDLSALVAAHQKITEVRGVAADLRRQVGSLHRSPA